MDEPIVYVDRSQVRAGSLPALKKAVVRLVQFIEEREGQLVLYAFHIDEEGSTMTVVAVHPDSASLELHLRTGGPEFRRMADLIELQSIEIYGIPGETARSLLDEKARVLGNARVTVHPRQAGFARLPASPADARAESST